MNYWKAFGRRKAGSWGRPHRGLRTSANRATRARQNLLTKKLLRSAN